MARKQRKSSSLVRDLEEKAYHAGKAKLDDLQRQMVDAESKIKEQLYQLLEKHKAVTQELVEQRSRIILETSATNARAGFQLENDVYYRIPVLKGTVWAHKGAIVKFVYSKDEPAAENSEACGLPAAKDQKVHYTFFSDGLELTLTCSALCL